MAQDNMPPDDGTTHEALNPLDPYAIQQMMAALASISRDELPDGADRRVLEDLIRWGDIDNLYTPFGHTHHVIAWARMPAWLDPRQTLTDWLEEREATREIVRLMLNAIRRQDGQSREAEA